MKITAISDIHGYLPEIEETDLLIIAGDWSTLEIQQYKASMEQWIEKIMIPWFQSVKAKKIIFIAGNHDFICLPEFWSYNIFEFEYDFKIDFLKPLLRKNKLEDKVEYLCDESTIYNDLKIFGCPHVTGLHGWAFSEAEVFDSYSKIKKCDILVTHQPPKFNGLGESCVKKKTAQGVEKVVKMDFGSEELLRKLKTIKPSLLFCGHVHGGNHNESIITHSNNKTTKCYNVSLKDEDYNVHFKPLTIEL